MLSLHYDQLACQAVINKSIDYQLPIFTLNYSFAQNISPSNKFKAEQEKLNEG